jgi:tRNA-dihydrouridine synthase B
VPTTAGYSAIASSLSGDVSLIVSLLVILLENLPKLLNIAEALDYYPLSEIIIHPRTGAQMYDGTVDIDRFEQCLPKFSCPVVYNGDIRTADDFKALQSRFSSIDRWMIGRGLIANPFLAEEIRGITSETPMRQERLSAFLDALLEGYSEELSGPAHILGRMKELWKYLALSVEGGDRLLHDIRRATSVEEYRGIVRRL